MSNWKAAVVGAGIMGSGIAQACIEAGVETKLIDISRELADKGAANITHFLRRKVEKGKLSEEENKVILEKLSVANSLKEARGSNIVIEAVTENQDIKLKVFEQLSEACCEETLLASNTSTISITLLGSATKHPENVLGLHFFVPAPIMKLVEVIPGLLTSSKTLQKGIEFSKSINKIPVKAPDTSAFIVNRLLVPMWNEAMFLVQEGNEPEDIDTAMKLGGNLPMGPLELADFAGLDTVLAVMTQMYKDLGEEKYRPCPLLKKMVAAKLLGRKSRKGFYDY